MHGDLKPGNVMMTSLPSRTCKIIDFGEATARRDTLDTTQMASHVGTIGYMAPEMLDPNMKRSHTVDSYAYAILVNEMFAEQVPFEGLAPVEIISRVSSRGERPAIAESLPDNLCAVVNRYCSGARRAGGGVYAGVYANMHASVHAFVLTVHASVWGYTRVLHHLETIQRLLAEILPQYT